MEKDVLALDVRRLREALTGKLEAVFALGHARLALRSGLQERRMEAQARMHIQVTTVRTGTGHALRWPSARCSPQGCALSGFVTSHCGRSPWLAPM